MPPDRETQDSELKQLRQENEELRETLRQLTSRHGELVNLLSRIDVAAVFLDSELRVERFTPQALRLFELGGADLGRELAEVRTHARDADIVALCREAREDGGKLLEREVATGDGRAYLLRIVPLLAGEAAVLDGLALACIDITARKNREDELRLAYERLNQDQEVSHTGNFDRNFKTGEGFWSDHLYRLFGYEPDEVENLQSLFFEHVHPEDLDTVKQALREAENGEPYDVTFRYHPRGQGQRWGHSQGRMEFDAHGAPVRLHGIFQDITSQKEFEHTLEVERNRLAMALEASGAGVYEISLTLNGRQYRSPKWYEIHGVRKQDIPQDHHEFYEWYSTRIAPDGLAVMRNVLEEYLRGERQSHREVYRYKKPSGEWIWIQSVGRKVAYETGEVHLVGAAVDVSSQMQDREELRAHRDRLQELVRSGSRELARSEALHRTVIEHFPNGSVVVFDHDLRYQLAGGEALEESGLRPEDLVGRTVRDIFPPDFADKVETMFRKALAGEAVLTELEYAGELYEVHVLPVRDDGEVVAGMAQSTRVTEKRAAARERHEREQIYRNLIANAPDIIARFDSSHAIAFVNEAIERYTRQPVERFLGSTVDVLQLEASQRRSLVQALQHAFTRGEEAMAQVTATFDGQHYTFHIRMAPERDVSGKVQSVLCIARDITGLFALQKERERLLELIEATPDLVYTMGASGELIYCNRGACDILGLELDRPEARMHAGDIYPEDELRQLRETFMPRAREQGFWSGESRLLCREGKELAIKQTVISQKLDPEQGELFSVIAHDLSELKERESELHKAKERAEAASRSKSEFLANMSHELRTPIAGILGMTSLLLRDQALSKARDKLQMIRQAGESLLEIINDVLDLAKIEAKGLQIEKQPFEPRAMLEQLENFFKLQAMEKGLALSVRLDESLPGNLCGDEHRIAQVLRNLVGNAIKFTNQGSVLLRVQLVKERSRDMDVFFSVDDTGIGIPREEQDRLFTSFTQLDSSYAKAHGGTGLGLAISSELVSLMGGSIAVESAPGEGSRFWFTLPLERVRSETETDENGEQAGAGTSGQPSGPGRGLHARVLVVEDNAINRLYVEELLCELGMDAVLAEGGEQALRLLQEQEFDCVLMDVQMPGMDGIEATHRIRQSGSPWQDIPIIALTAYAMKGDSERFLKEGMDEYLAKPVESQDLLQAIGKVLGTRPGRGSPPAQPDARTAADGQPAGMEAMVSEERAYVQARMRKLRQAGMLFREFLGEVDDKRRAIEERFREQDYEELAGAAHSLGGAAGVLGLQQLLQQVRVVDDRDFAHKTPEQRRTAVDLLLRRLEAARLVVQSELEDLNAKDAKDTNDES